MTQEEESHTVREFSFGIDKDQKNLPFKFCSNFIKTAKYNLLTFVPVSLIIQFKIYANVYFLLTAIL